LEALAARFGGGEQGDNSDEADVTTAVDRNQLTLARWRPVLKALQAAGVLPGAPQGELLLPDFVLHY